MAPSNPGVAAPTIPQSPQATGPNYEHDLEGLYDSIVDSVSARKAAPEIADFAQKIKLPSERAILELSKAKSFLYTSGLNRACPIFKNIKKADLPSKLQSELDDAVQSCSSP